MSRSGYTDDHSDDMWHYICYRGAVSSAIRGRRGQAFLRDLKASIESHESKRLVAHDLEHEGDFCALGVLGKKRGIDMSGIDPEDSELVADVFGIAESLAREIVYLNDEHPWHEEPEQRWARMLRQVSSMILEDE